ncbi:uncharacterized protein LOC123504150 [Portunus trituberculatus]|uniref:uncharacterized protein LOC123504150 n=1 Tax=Portunus trituberculatus TaxID=210409 RepID=UPI001E1D06AF|nr:uncharacterized protein LOC123504150 [Portunus trituberculatus]
MKNFVCLVVVMVLLQKNSKSNGAKIYDHPEPLPRARPAPFQPRTLTAPSNAAFSANMAGMARLESLDVKCGRTGMNVELRFSAVFPGVVYSKGHFSDSACLYLKESDPRSDVYKFTIPIDGCGTKAEEGLGVSGKDREVGNTVIIQSDPLIQEVWDEARHITCSWSHSMTKSVAFLPLKVYEPEMVDVQFDSRSVNTLMEIQRGTRGADGPLPAPPTGYVHVGDDISVVMYVKGKQTDANVISCNGTTAGRSASVALVDSQGCVLRPDLLTPFAKTRKVNGVEADLMLYSYLKAFNIAESPEFIISCALEVCENSCPEPCAGGAPKSRRRRRRRGVEVEEELEEEVEEVGSSSSSSSSSSSYTVKKIVLEKGVMVLDKEEGRVQCLVETGSVVVCVAVLVAVVCCLAVVCAVLACRLCSRKYIKKLDR